MLLQTKLHTVETFEEFIAHPENVGRNFELIHGEIVEKTMPTELHGVLAANLIIELGIYLRQRKMGRLGTEVRNRMSGDEYNSRQPDISYFLDDSRPMVTKGAVPQMPDLAIEVKSSDDTYKMMREKADYYLASGAQMVWLILTEKQTVEVHRPGKLDVLGIDDTLDGGELLPGFTLPVRNLFPQAS